MDTEKKLLLSTFEKNKDYLNHKFDTMSVTILDRKSIKQSELSRNKGNERFKQKNRDAESLREIFEYYCESICHAPLNSDVLAKAYANRSAFLFYIHKYKDCINDIDRCLKITESNVSKIMLLCRKVQCMKKLGQLDYQDVLNETQDYAKKVDTNNEVRVDELIRKAKACTINNPGVEQNDIDRDDVLPKLDERFDCVSIEYDEKYGRHLIAKKDYNPGDFIFHDDLYVTMINSELCHINCNYCLKICWHGVACDYCTWAMFCSDECKKKAWDDYHGVECTVIPCLEKCHLMYHRPLEMSLRLLLVGIREAGSIDGLKEKLKLVDECTDPCKREFFKGQYATIQSIYSLESSELCKLNAGLVAKNVLVALMSIVKHDTLITNIKFHRIDDIVSNENLIFLGSLLIKFLFTSINNLFLFGQTTCDCQRLKRTDYKCCDRGNGIATLSNLLSHSCNPNVARIFTEDRKIHIFALQPIKKDSQIFTTYAGFYFNKSPGIRKQSLQAYNFTCDCEACMGSWPPLFLLPYEELVANQSKVEKKLEKGCKSIFEAIDIKKIDFDKKDVKQLCKTIVLAHKQLSKPNFLIASLEDSLLIIYSRIYSWKSPIHDFAKKDDA